MPAYSQPQYSRYQGYLTPPDELLRNYAKEHMNTHQYPQNPYAVPTQAQQDGNRSHAYHDPYSHHTQHRSGPGSRVSPPRPMYPGAPYLTSINAVPSHHNNGYYKPVVLPPMRTYPPVTVESRPQVTRPSQPQQEPKEERPVGGVSAKLDYEMDTMTDFVAKTAHGMYELLTSPSICIADIDLVGSIMPNRPVPASFRKWVQQVLSATRLPSSTILLAFDYLTLHMRQAQASRMVEYGETELYHMLTTALILGSKFLDDNTFINRSWAEVSGIDVQTLNRLEHQWLDQMSFRLHREPNVPGGFQTFQTSWQQFEAERRIAHDTGRSMHASSHMPINQINYGPSSQSAYEQISPPAYSAAPQSSYTTTGYPRYDSFVPMRSSTTTSPASAPHTGPTTPEYYSHSSTWPSITEAYGPSRLLPSAYTQPPSAPPAMVTTQSTVPAFVTTSYQAAPVYATSHGSECFCNTCNRQYMMVPHFGMPQSVVG